MGQERTRQQKDASAAKLKRMNKWVEDLCGIYTRVARRLGLHRRYVSRVARGERRSEAVEEALLSEYNRARNH